MLHLILGGVADIDGILEDIDTEEAFAVDQIELCVSGKAMYVSIDRL